MASRITAPRNVTVWLPAWGQRLRDEAGLPTAFRHRVDDEIVALAYQGMGWPPIVVGIDSIEGDAGDLRHPPSSTPRVPAGTADGHVGYLDFLVRELKPAIDQTFRTRRGPSGTVLAGVGSAGLLSLRALARFPHIFSGAAYLHGAPRQKDDLADEPRRLTIKRLLRQMPLADHHRLYLDFDDEGRDLPARCFCAR